jgi:hypothetical protein
MTPWEYEIRSVRFGDWDQTKEDLNKIGIDGWELVKFSDYIDENMRMAYFKRSLDGLEM